MTFPLGSLRAEGGATSASGAGTYRRERARPPVAATAHASSWRLQLRLLVGGVLGLLALIALVTHSALDPAFSTSGGGGEVSNKAGIVGAWFSDLAYFVAG